MRDWCGGGCRFITAAGIGVGLLVAGTAGVGAQGSAMTFEGDAALFTVAIKADKTADFEQIMKRVRQALTASDKPERKKQAEGWKVMRIQQPLPDGTVAFVHVINPVVPGADYSVMQLLYDAFPDERQALYELYRGAFAKNLSLATGAMAVDLARAEP